jgi:nucleotide-binding universal stress UspA family protein
LKAPAAEFARAGLTAELQVEAGDAEALVMDAMAASPYDVVALGALAKKRQRRRLTSVAMGIIEHAQASVLVIHGERQRIRRVLICASGTEQGHLPVWAGAALACGAGARTTLLHVVDAMPSMYAGLERMEETLGELLQSGTERARELKWAAQVVRAECDISELKLRRGIAAEEILREAQQGDHDLIVMGSSRGANGVMRVLLGDLTRDVVTKSDRPVLVVRPGS